MRKLRREQKIATLSDFIKMAKHAGWIVVKPDGTEYND